MEELTRAFKAQSPLAADFTYLNAGTLAPTLNVVQEFVGDLYREWQTRGPGAAMGDGEANGYFDLMVWNDRARERIAQWMGTNPRSVALTGNATDGANLALTSLRWQPGDRICLSSEEHEALRYPIQRLIEQYGIEADVVPFPAEGGEAAFAEQLAQNIQPRTRMVAFSSVSHKSGVALNLDAVTTALPRRDDLWVLVDGAHAAGTQVQLLAPNVDFYCYPGHKWLFGPVGTGVLWVSRRALDGTDTILSGAPVINQARERMERRDGAWRFEYGTRDWTKAAGLAKAIEFRSQWSEDTIVAHYRNLTEAFRAGYVRSGASAPMLGTGPVVSITTPAAQAVCRDLWETHRVYIKGGDTGLRASLAPWFAASELFDLGELVGRTVAQLGSGEDMR